MFRIKYSREAVLKLLYLTDVLEKEDLPAHQLLENNLCFFDDVNQIETDFILKILEKIIEKGEEIDRLISENLIGWKLERLLSVDRSLLRMGIAESYFNDQKAVIIDDVIRIAKKYGGEESYKIINAILDKIIR
ncbi:MAG: transcription antitermination factor NusB [bacterium]|nr:transcription antitermination factor NusB [bacterium]